MVGEETARGGPAAVPLLLVEKVGSIDTAERWARRLQAVLERPEDLRAMRAAAAEFARKNWSWERAAEAYAEIFRAVIGPAKGS